MLNNQIKQNMVFSLGTLVVLALGAMSLPATVSASNNYTFGGDTGNAGFSTLGNTNGQNVNNYYPTTTYYPPAPTNPVAYVNYNPQPAPLATVYSSSTNPNAVATTTTPKTVAKAKTTTTTNTTIVKTDTSANKALTAGAIFGSNSFAPSGIIQWILFAILVLLIVILARKIYGADETYDAVPLKHD